MSRRSSPRPTYDTPTLIRYEQAALHLWGDHAAGYVGDRIYASTSRIHTLELTLAPGARFGHSGSNKTVFAADEVYYVLEGELLLTNPETGEVELAGPGDSIFFRRDTWHHGINRNHDRPLRAIEFFAPPPSTGTSSAYASTRPDLPKVRYYDDRWLGRWPMARDERDSSRSLRLVGARDLLWRIEGPEDDLLVGLIASTEHLTAGVGSLTPGRRSAVRRHEGELVLIVVAGSLGIFVPDGDVGQCWFELRAGDGFFMPSGTAYQVFAPTSERADFVFGVAPNYRPYAG